MIQAIRRSKMAKVLVVYFALHISIVGPFFQSAFALTSGPAQPEMQGPSALSFDNYVDPFTGDFNYAIPLFEMGDIPLTLNYSSGVTPDQEASWVGLGWTLNPGSITRTVRGLPDDFKEDIVTNTLNMKPNVTYGASITGGTELFGFDMSSSFFDDIAGSLSLTLSAYYNNYNGFGVSTSVSPSISCGGAASVGFSLNGGTGSLGDAGLTAGFDIGALVNNATKSEKDEVKYAFPLSGGISLNSKTGLQSITLNTGCTKNFMNRFGNPADFKCDQTYTPSAEHSFENYSETYSASGGGFPIAGLDINIAVSGYGSTQKLVEEEKVLNTKAYGYMYLDDTQSGDIIMDFNREKESAQDANSPNLPLPFMTYDIFSISSPGLNGSFRAYRNDIGYIKERNATVTNASSSAGFEFSVGGFASPGFDVTQTDVYSNSGTWSNYNEAYSNLAYSSPSYTGSLNENVYFAMTNESGYNNGENFIQNNLGNKNPVELRADNLDLVQILDNTLLDKSDAPYNLNSPTMINGRQSRVTNISYLTVEQYNKYRPYYNYNLSDLAKDHHIAEITVTAADGTRYVYGLPAYNNKQVEVTFNVGKSDESDPSPEVDDDKNLVKYSGTQNSIGNESGKDYFYNELETPAYAHSYMLTAVLSPNYVDVLGDGPTQDDLGNYIKYTYGDLVGGVYEPNVENFKWRTPTVSSADIKKANYAEGLINNPGDDRANYVYGEKEIWYLYSIETKTYTAYFDLLDRADALGAEGRDGGVDEETTLKYLSQIRLYSTADLMRDNYTDIIATGAQPDEDLEPVPLKTIHFEYDYSLCEGIPNKTTSALSGDGKLTLKKVYFTYEESYKAKYNAYTFEYENNYDYAYEDNDRWGNYKPNTGEVENKYFPYVSQDDSEIDNYASAWSLAAINLPQGGRLEVDYESDDYAYVQDREATMMYMVRNAFREFHPENVDDDGYYVTEDPILEPAFEGLASAGYLPRLYTADDELNLYLVFDIPEDNWLDADYYSQSQADAYIKEHCVLGEFPDADDPGRLADNLYFRFSLNTDDFDHADPPDESMDPSEERPEFVSGFATINESAAGDHWAGAIMTDGIFKQAFILVTAVNAEFKDILDPVQSVHPITKSGWQFSMLNTRYNVLDEPVLKQDLNFEAVLEELGNASFFDGLMSLFSNPNNIMRNKKIANAFDPAKSWIRLGTMDGIKKGGGCRVKTITMYDNWDEMTTAEDAFSYTKEYSYKLPNSNRSSGVAAYEPLIGADEIPHHIPDNYSHKDLDATYSKYTEHPYGESFFPAPLVGYSYVEVKNKTYDDVHRTATGKTVYEFYTAKDFPVIVDQTELIPLIKKPESSLSLMNTSIVNLYTGTQGYSIEVNDMHGKPKKVSVYKEGDFLNPITETEYKYFEDANGGRLENTVRMVDAYGNISNGEMGVTYDFTVDMRSQNTQSYGVTAEANLEMMSFAGIPVVFPFMLTSNDYGYASTNISVTSKVITRTGIIKEVITRQDGSKVVTKNELFDKETGVAVLTSAQNEFDDDYYNLNYLSHWVYPGMGMAYSNDNFEFSTTSDFASYIDPNTGLIGGAVDEYFYPGDEIILRIYLDDAYPEVADFDEICWVYQKTIGTPSLYAIDENGEEPGITGTILKVDAEVIRSGHRNMSGQPIAGIVCKYIPESNPGEASSDLFVNADNHIIQANAMEYSDRWQNFCLSNDNEPYCIVGTDQHATNPYNRGFLGVWRPLVNYLYLTNREYTYEKDENTTDFDGVYTNMRTDGAFTTFAPFWQSDGTAWSKVPTNWTWSSSAQTVNPYADEVETINALGIYSSASYGYNNEKPVIVCNNAQYQEIGFENFEDEYYYEALEKPCDQQHFTLSGGVVSYAYAHSGNFSYYIPYTYEASYSTTLRQHYAPREADTYGTSFMIESGDCLPSFAPEANASEEQKYVMTFWLKRKYTGAIPVTYEDFSVEVNYNGDDILDPTVSSSAIIEDWQRFEYTFTIPASAAAENLTISITNNDYFELFVDDIRVHPFDAAAKTYVYDFRTQRLMGELDENHYCTFYEYDEDGKLVRVKKETEKGIMTIQEGKYFTKKAE